jgi:hypothetical protein
VRLTQLGRSLTSRWLTLLIVALLAAGASDAASAVRVDDVIARGTVGGQLVESEPNNSVETADALGVLEKARYFIIGGIVFGQGGSSLDCNSLSTTFPPGTVATFDADFFTFDLPTARSVVLKHQVLDGEVLNVYDSGGRLLRALTAGASESVLDLAAGRFVIQIVPTGERRTTYCYVVELVVGGLPAVAELTFDPPAGGGLDPPAQLAAEVIGFGQAAAGAAREPSGDGTTAAQGVAGYRIYQASTPNVPTTPSNLLATLPPNQTTTTATVPEGGSYFVVTADYGEGGESGSSNEVGVGQPGADVLTVKAKGGKLKATGTGFTDRVAVFADGIPFVAAAKVKKSNTVVRQTGTLVTGMTIPAFFTSGKTVEVAFVNDDGGITRHDFTAP